MLAVGGRSILIVGEMSETGEMLKAHKPVKSDGNDRHGEGFKEVFDKAMDRYRTNENRTN